MPVRQGGPDRILYNHAMATKIAIRMIGQVFIVGCNQRTNNNADVAVDKRVAATIADTARVDDPFSDNPFADADWTGTTELDAIDFAKAVDYQLGDLVPCSDDKAEYILKINALNGGNCLYRCEHGFQRYDERNVDPTSESGMTQENNVFSCSFTQKD